jgi:hypothetical protein
LLKGRAAILADSQNGDIIVLSKPTFGLKLCTAFSSSSATCCLSLTLMTDNLKLFEYITVDIKIIKIK